MTFAELSFSDQADRVREALKTTLNRNPSIDDYSALLGATQAVIDELKHSLFRAPLPRWQVDTAIVSNKG